MNKDTAPRALLQVRYCWYYSYCIPLLRIPQKSPANCQSLRKLLQSGFYHSRGTELTLSEARSTSSRTRVHFAVSSTIPVSISPLHSLVDGDLRTDQRLPLVRIQKPKALGKKTQSLAVVSGSSCSASGASHIDMLPPIDYGELRERILQVSI